MRALVFHGVGDLRIDEVEEPKLQAATDAIVRLTASAICGTDLHMVRGTMPGMKAGTILGHEGVGIVEAVGDDVRNLRPGDRVVIPSTIACGVCAYCRAGYHAQCDTANPHGKRAGTAFYGGPEQTGPFHGLQAEKARIPYAHVNLVKLPDEVSDEQAIVLSDILPTGYFGADLANIEPDRTVAVFGCGPVGLCAILSAKLMGAGRLFAVDRNASRLAAAVELGAEVVDFDREDPVETILRLTDGIGVDRVIDAVGVDAEAPDSGPASERVDQKRQGRELEAAAQDGYPEEPPFRPGGAPSQVADWCVASLAKAGTLAIIGVYPPSMRSFPIGQAMMKNLTIRMGNCNHRAYIPKLIEMVRSGRIEPGRIVSVEEPMVDALEAYRRFDRQEAGWIKVMLTPPTQAAE